MTREKVIERARRAIPDFLRKKKPDPPAVPPINPLSRKRAGINWLQLFRLADNGDSSLRGD